MSKGIIVVEGAEEEHYNLLGKDRLHPIINVYPEENEGQRIFRVGKLSFKRIA